MRTQLDIVKHRLFEREALNVSNVKLFPGSNRDASAEQIAEQINKAIAQIEAGDYDLVDDCVD